jgi:hypothetical protein
MPGFFKKIEKKYALGFLGVVATIIFGVFGLYSIFHEKQPSILFDITGESNVLDVREPLRDLAISFQGQDIQQKNLNLRIFTVRVENNGEVDILQGHYDQNEVWGAAIDNGKIIEARLINTNSDYLQSNLNPRLVHEDTIQLSKTIFDRGKFFVLEILVLHEKDVLPQITPIGKIAGIDRITLTKSWLAKDKQTFLTQLLSGGVLVHLARLAGYLLTIIAVLVIVVSIGSGISNISSTKKTARRKRIVDTLLKDNKIKLDDDKKNILTVTYLNQDPEGLIRLQKLLQDQKKLLRGLRQYNIRKEAEDKLSELEEKPAALVEPVGEVFVLDDTTNMRISDRGEIAVGPSGEYVRRVYRWPHMNIAGLIRANVISRGENDEVLVDDNFKLALDILIDYLAQKKKNELPSY